MINVSTATPDEIVSEAIAILQSVKKHDMSVEDLFKEVFRHVF